MKKFLHLALALVLATPSAWGAGRIQNEDVKSQAEIQAAVSTTGTLTSGNACITAVGSLTGLSAGLFIYDSTNSARINSGVTIAAIPGTCSAGQIQMSANAAGSGTGDTLTFGGQVSQLINDTKMYVTANSINSRLDTAITNGLLGGAGGTKNYLANGVVTSNSSGSPNPGNGDFEKNSTSGWSIAHSALTSNIPTSVGSAGVPLSSVAGLSSASGTIGISAIASTIQKNYMGQLSVTGPVVGDLLLSSAFYIDNADQAKMMQIKFSYANNGATNLNFSGTSANTMSIWIYDVTNAVWIQPQGVYNLTQSAGVGTATATFQTSSNGTRYQLALIENVTAPGAFTLFLDDFQVGPATASANGPAMSDWVAYTPTFANLGTVTAIGIYSRRVGDSLEVHGRFTVGTTVAAIATMTVGYNGTNGNVVIDSGKTGGASNVVGTMNVNTAGAAIFAWTVISPATNLNVVSFGNQTSALASTGATNGSQLSGNGFVYEVNFKVPIVGWSSNSVMSADTDTRVVSFSATAQANAGIGATPTTLLWNSPNIDTHSAFSSSNTYTIPVSGTYQINVVCIPQTPGSGGGSVGTSTCSLLKNGSGYANAFSQYGTTFCGTANYCSPVTVNTTGIFKAGDALTVQYNQNAGSTGPQNLTVSSWQVNRISGPAVISATDSVSAFYNGNPTFSPGLSNSTESTVTFPTKIKDSHGAMSGSSYTIPVSGTYSISASMLNTGTYGTKGTIISRIKVNGTTIVDSRMYSNSGGAGEASNAIEIKSYPMNAGDVVTMTMTPAGFTSIAFSTTATVNWFSIMRSGN